MEYRFILLAACAAFWAGMAMATPPEPDKKPPAAPAKPSGSGGIAVVELFTSEGCSSCPPADALLTMLATEKKKLDGHVYYLAFHVDYWDHLGWKDPFGNKTFSDRQRSYAAHFAKAGGKGSVYTPQMVVNGAAEFVGSDESSARDKIAEALKREPKVEIVPTIAPRKPGEPIRISATIKPLDAKPDGTRTLCIALIEDGLSSSVKRGENSGRTLPHDRVVRAFAEKKLESGKDAAEVEIKPPEGVKEDNCRVVLFVQDAATMAIVGAADTALPAPAAPDPKPAAPPTPAQSPKPTQKK